jgi:hypothetical protein
MNGSIRDEHASPHTLETVMEARVSGRLRAEWKCVTHKKEAVFDLHSLQFHSVKFNAIITNQSWTQYFRPK